MSAMYPTPDDKFWLGGAQVGHRNICFACAELAVTGDELVLKLADFHHYAFKPQQVTKVESWDCGETFPAAGIRLQHQIPSYPSEIAFWFHATNAAPFVAKLNQLGFGQTN
jgi:hypothetical protein